MKLNPPLKPEQKARAAAAAKALTDDLRAYHTAQQASFDVATELQTLEEERQTLRASKAATAKVAERLNTLKTQIELVTERGPDARQAEEAARREVVGTIRYAHGVMYEFCAPLAPQMKLEMAEALRPFCLKPEEAVSRLEGGASEGLERLTRFLQRGMFINHGIGSDDIEHYCGELGGTLRRLARDLDVFSLRPEELQPVEEEEAEEAAAA